jgi:hypothetical protein
MQSISTSTAARPSRIGNALTLAWLIARLALADTVRASSTIFIVQIVRFDVVHHWLWDEIANRHVATTKETNLGGRDIVLDQLLDDPDVVFPFL